jgi:hypothetical protein
LSATSNSRNEAATGGSANKVETPAKARMLATAGMLANFVKPATCRKTAAAGRPFTQE